MRLFTGYRLYSLEEEFPFACEEGKEETYDTDYAHDSHDHPELEIPAKSIGVKKIVSLF